MRSDRSRVVARSTGSAQPLLCLRRLHRRAGRFKAAYKGQMELYLRWLERHGEGEASPLGLILCAEGSHEQIELLELDKTSIHVAEYLTDCRRKRFWNANYARPLKQRERS
jgi:hypothetical protein